MEPLELVATSILGPTVKAKIGNQYIMVITTSPSKLTKAVSTSKKAKTAIATIFIEHWIVSYGKPSKVKKDKGSQFTSKFIAGICTQLVIKAMRTTEYHPHVNYHVKRFNRAVVSKLQRYVAELLKTRDTFVLLLIYAYNSQEHPATKRPPFILVLTQKAQIPAVMRSTTPLYIHSVDLAISKRFGLMKKATLLQQLATANLR